jgi:hypothetical protein
MRNRFQAFALFQTQLAPLRGGGVSAAALGGGVRTPRLSAHHLGHVHGSISSHSHAPHNLSSSLPLPNSHGGGGLEASERRYGGGGGGADLTSAYPSSGGGGGGGGGGGALRYHRGPSHSHSFSGGGGGPLSHGHSGHAPPARHHNGHDAGATVGHSGHGIGFGPIPSGAGPGPVPGLALAPQSGFAAMLALQTRAHTPITVGAKSEPGSLGLGGLGVTKHGGGGGGGGGARWRVSLGRAGGRPAGLGPPARGAAVGLCTLNQVDP